MKQRPIEKPEGMSEVEWQAELRESIRLTKEGIEKTKREIEKAKQLIKQTESEIEKASKEKARLEAMMEECASNDDHEQSAVDQKIN